MSRVLVIDDESTILENIKFVLELDEHEVLTAPGGEEGIELFKQNVDNIDVVISDMKMPKLSGMDVIKAIKAVMPEMGVIVLTGHGDMENAILAMKEGAFEYLKKPVNADDLAIAINNAISKKNLLLENARMQREILEHNQFLQGLTDSAEKILMNMIPKNYPEIPGFRFTAEYKSSDAVGGDMYDVCDIGDYLCFYVFDVSSHGILAAVVGVILKSFIQNMEYNFIHGLSRKGFDEIISDLNKELYMNTANNVFATLFIGFIEKSTRKLYYISAGHIMQYVCNSSGITPLTSSGTILGVFEDATYSCESLQLGAGDKIVLFTDGILEATSDDCIFGYENLVSVLENSKADSIERTVSNILDSVSSYSNGVFQDDVTLLGIEITG